MANQQTVLDVVRAGAERDKRIAQVTRELIDPDLTVDEVAAALKVEKSTVLTKLRNHEIVGYQIGRTWRIPEEELRAYKQRLIDEQRDAHRIAKIEAEVARKYKVLKKESSLSDPQLLHCPSCEHSSLIVTTNLTQSDFWGYHVTENRFYIFLRGTCEACGYEYRRYDRNEVLADRVRAEGGDERLYEAVRILNDALNTVNHAERLRLLRIQLADGYTADDVQRRLRKIRSDLSRYKVGETEETRQELQRLEEELEKHAQPDTPVPDYYSPDY